MVQAKVRALVIFFTPEENTNCYDDVKSRVCVGLNNCSFQHYLLLELLILMCNSMDGHQALALQSKTSDERLPNIHCDRFLARLSGSEKPELLLLRGEGLAQSSSDLSNMDDAFLAILFGPML
ncbi:hypothetical protein llap_16709 [Limosa lapponica baueri]|uniref:Uncharacterized protein n=1 Tax=Limosa lapponica baueri TaxID=1758121 RepID=A0A2I0TGQ7_LIMLA|nr:hypothetical protein llap_16709 [Limosa lapponica baueri]